MTKAGEAGKNVEKSVQVVPATHCIPAFPHFLRLFLSTPLSPHP
jgi:hypothetical protein